MELKELKKKSEKDLHKILADNRGKLRELKFKDANKQLKDVRQIRKARQTIARVLTLLNSRAGEGRAQTADTAEQTTKKKGGIDAESTKAE